MNFTKFTSGSAFNHILFIFESMILQMMKNKWFKRVAIVLGTLLGIVLLANAGLNFWLKHNLPDFLKKNSDYIVNYKMLDVDIGTGNIFLTGFSVNNKNPQNHEVIGLQGTIDTIKVSRLGIIDAVFNKQISTSDLYLGNPKLNITLARKKDKGTNKKKNPVKFENIRINRGKIIIFKPDMRKFLSVDDLSLYVENLQMTEESIENKLPVVFDHYNINGKYFYFRPDNVYAIAAKKITTENGKMSVKDFKLVPLISPSQFIRFYPHQKNLFSMTSESMDFTDILLDKNKFSLKNMSFQNPNILIHITDAKPLKKQKTKSQLNISLEDILLKNAIIQIKKANENPVFSGQNIDVKINKFIFDEKTSTQKIPFSYSDFSVAGNHISFFTNHQEFSLGKLIISPKNILFEGISAHPTAIVPSKTTMKFAAQKINIDLNTLNFDQNKLNLDIEDIVVNGLNGTIKPPVHPQNKKTDFSGITLPIPVKNVVIKNSNIILEKGNQPLAFNDLNANFKDILVSPQNSGKLAFDIGNYSATTKNFKYETPFYNINAGLIKLNKTGIQVHQFSMLPKVSRAQFIKMIPTEKDLYTLKASQITMTGKWDLFSRNKFLEASNITIQSADANIFRSKIPKDDPKTKPLYSELLRSIKFPMFVHNLDIKNSLLEYEEDTKQSDGPGKLTFSNFNLNAKNLNSAKMKGKPTEIPISITCKFFGVSPMNVKWKMNTANRSDAFTIAGNISSLPAVRINPFVEPYLKIRTTGSIQNLNFNFHGNRNGLDGTFNMQHKDLKVNILKQGGEKDKVLSAVANLFVKSNSGNYPENVVVDDVLRDPTKSFFNLFWKGIEEGLKKTLIGKNVEKTEQTVKNTVQDVKSASKDVKNAVKDAKTSVKENVQNITKPEQKQEKKEKKNVFRKIFSKKEKAGE